MPDKYLNRSMSVIAAVLVIALVFVSIPNPKPANALTACLAAVASALGINIGAKAAAGTVGAVAGLYVPTFDIVNEPTFDITAISAAGLKTKSCADEILTAALKIAINLTRDMVIRWIITGRFEGPVFSTSFSADLAKTAENASRIFLSGLTQINFCSAFGGPPLATFSISADFGLSCTLPSDIDRAYGDTLIRLTTDPASVSLDQWLALKDPRNIVTTNYIRLTDERERAIARALISKSAEYAAGQGFLGIRDPSTGKILTPGSAVAKLVMESQIVSPIRQTDVADDVQTAIASIIDTAVRVFLEKGLAAAFGT